MWSIRNWKWINENRIEKRKWITEIKIGKWTKDKIRKRKEKIGKKELYNGKKLKIKEIIMRSY